MLVDKVTFQPITDPYGKPIVAMYDATFSSVMEEYKGFEDVTIDKLEVREIIEGMREKARAGGRLAHSGR